MPNKIPSKKAAPGRYFYLSVEILLMTREELVDLLYELMEYDDNETAHIKADEALLAYIDDSGIEYAYNLIDKWYA